jgi:ankyrin repeat protein/HEAT repeat protein
VSRRWVLLAAGLASLLAAVSAGGAARACDAATALSGAPPEASFEVTAHGSDALPVLDQIRVRGIHVVAIGSARGRPLVVPIPLRFTPISAAAFIEGVARWRGLSVSWWKAEETVAVLQAGAEKAELDRLLSDLAAPDDATSEYGAWRAGWGEDARVVPALLRALRDGGPRVTRSGLSSLRRLGWDAALALCPDSVLPLLEEDIRGGDPDLRKQALAALAETRSAKAIGLAERTLSVDGPSAMRALGGIGGDRALALVTKGVGDPDEAVRREAARALGMLGGQGARVILLQAVETEESPAVREADFSSLGRLWGQEDPGYFQEKLEGRDDSGAALALGEVGGEAARAILEAAARDPQKRVRKSAAAALGMIADPRSLPVLAAALRDPELTVRSAAAAALGRLGGPDACALLVGAFREDSTLEAAGIALGENGGKAGREAVGILWQVKDKRGFRYRQEVLNRIFALYGEPAILQNLMQSFGTLQDTDEIVTQCEPQAVLRSLSISTFGVKMRRAPWIAALAKVGGPGILPPLSQILGTWDPSGAPSRAAAARALLTVDSESAECLKLWRTVLDPSAAPGEAAEAREAFKSLRGLHAVGVFDSMLRSGIPSVQAAAAAALGDTRLLIVLSPLAYSLPDAPPGFPVEETVSAIARVGSSGTMNLLSAFLREKDARLRTAALGTVSLMDDAVSLPMLRKFVQQGDADSRAAFSEVLRRAPPVRAGFILRFLAGDADPVVRRGALASIAGLPAQAALPAVVAGLGDPDAEVRQAAAAALGGGVLPGRESVEAARGLLLDPARRVLGISALLVSPDAAARNVLAAAYPDGRLNGEVLDALRVSGGERMSGIIQQVCSQCSAEALIAAVEAGDAAAVRALLDNGANVELRYPLVQGGRSILAAAAFRGHGEVIRVLLASHARMTPADGAAALSLALAAGHRDVAALLLDRGVPPDARVGAFQETVLIEAARAGRREDCAFLLERGAGIDARSWTGATALIAAAGSGRTEVVADLLVRGADIRLADAQGRTARWMAGIGHYRETLKLILSASRGAAGDAEAGLLLVESGKQGDLDSVRLLVEGGVPLESADSRGLTALMGAARAGSIDVVRWLVERGARVRSADGGGGAPLTYAVLSKSPQVVGYLLDHGADVEARDKEKWTPLMFAAREDAVDVLRLLLARGADRNAARLRGERAIDECTSADAVRALGGRSRSWRLIQKLLEAEDRNDLPAAEELARVLDLTDTGSYNIHGGPIARAAVNGNLDMVKMLLDQGAPVSESYDQERGGGHDVNVVESALQAGQKEIAEYLVDRGADPTYLVMFAIARKDDGLFAFGLSRAKDVNATLWDGKTPLMYACVMGRLDLVLSLIARGADVNAQAKEPAGWGDESDVPPSDELWKDDALAAAIRLGSWDIIRVLLERGARPTVYDLEAALNATRTDLAAELLRRGAKPREATLVAACRAQEAGMAARFLDMGISPDARDFRGESAIGVAYERKNGPIVEMLLDRGAHPPPRENGQEN